METGAAEQAKARAGEHTQKALDTLESIPGLDPNAARVLDEITRALLNRDH